MKAQSNHLGSSCDSGKNPLPNLPRCQDCIECPGEFVESRPNLNPESSSGSMSSSL
jgi:hypothetical protein